MVVNFVSWRDREEVLRNAANKLRGTNIYITEDMSKKMREHRQELQKYARQESVDKGCLQTCQKSRRIGCVIPRCK